MIHPNSAEIKYRELLGLILDRIKAAVNAVLIPALPGLANSAQQSRLDGWVENTGRLLDDVAIYYGKTAPDYQAAVSNIGAQVSTWNNNQWRKVMNTTMGVDVFPQSPGLSDRLAIFAQQNKELIKGYTDTAFKNINVTAMNALRQGKRHEEIARDLQMSYGVSKNRAKLIARDQVAKLNGDLTQMRQQSSGIEIYIWRAMHDERTRKSHLVLDGKYCRWDDFTVYADNPNGPWKPRSVIGGYDQGHIGDDFQCRCFSEPHFADIEAILKGETQPAPEPVEPIQPQALPTPAPVVIPAPTIPVVNPVSAAFDEIIKGSSANSKTAVGVAANSIRNEPVEYIVSANRPSKILKRTDNKPAECSIGRDDWLSNNFLIHNHPRDSLFSSADLKVFDIGVQKKFMVVGKDTTYVLKPRAAVFKAAAADKKILGKKLGALNLTPAEWTLVDAGDIGKIPRFTSAARAANIADDLEYRKAVATTNELYNPRLNLTNNVIPFDFGKYEQYWSQPGYDPETLLKAYSKNKRGAFTYEKYDINGIHIDADNTVPANDPVHIQSELFIPDNGGLARIIEPGA